MRRQRRAGVWGHAATAAASLATCSVCAVVKQGSPSPSLAVYVLDELVTTLGAGDSRAGVDAVCARLAHRSPVVKQKVRQEEGAGSSVMGSSLSGLEL